MIPFNRPTVVGSEINCISEALAKGSAAGDGIFTKKCHALLEETLNVPKVLLTTSCTSALEMAGILLGLGPEDEVIVPSFTFVSTPNAFVLRGAKPVFADIRPDTLNIDETEIEKLITPRTRAVVPVHYGGVGCEMDAICAVASRHNLTIIEDNAHGLYGTYRGRYLGTFGAFATQSFHGTKNFTCGEGGALLINDPRYFERAEIIREKGTNRGRFFRGEVDKYTWVDIGSSFLPSDLLAAMLLSQLQARDMIQSKRKKIWDEYYAQLEAWASEYGIGLPVVPAHCDQAYHVFYLLLPSLQDRTALIKHLNRRDIKSAFHYLPLHLSDMGRQFGGQMGDCPIAERVSDCLLRLPYFTDLSEDDQARVIEAVLEFRPAGC